jgi:hypothetical protein
MMSLLFYFTESVKRDNDELSFSFLSAKARILVFYLTEQTEKKQSSIFSNTKENNENLLNIY